MGPTDKSSLSTSDYNGGYTPQGAMNSYQNNNSTVDQLPSDWGIVRKLRLTEGTIERYGSLLKLAVSTVQAQLSRLNLPPEVVHYKRAWVEGPLSERFSNPVSVSSSLSIIIPADPLETSSSTPSSGPVTEEVPTFLCLLMEPVDPNQVTLQDWLNGRSGSFLYESQITCIIAQLLSALKFHLEHNVSLLNGISCSNIYVMTGESPFASELLPKLKLDCLSLAKLTNLIEDGDQASSTGLKSAFEFVAGLYTQLLQSILDTAPEIIDKNVELAYPEEFKIIQELVQDNIIMSPFTVSAILTKLEAMKGKTGGILLNVDEASRSFVGRSEEMDSLFQAISGSGAEPAKNNLIVIQGPSGSGKSEMIRHLSRALLTRNSPNRSGPTMNNILCLNASSVDTLTRSIHACATHSKLQVATKDYLGNPKLLKDIFQAMLLEYNDADNNVLVIFENADSPSEEMIDLVNIFKEHTKCEPSSSSLPSKQYLIVVMKEIWSSSSSLLEDSTTVAVTGLNSSDSIKLLRDNLPQVEGESGEIQEITEILQNLPAALQMAIKVSKNGTFASFKELLTSLNESVKMEPHSDEQILKSSPSLIYSLSLKLCYESLSEPQKPLANKVLMFLQHFDGESGISLQALHEVLQNVPGLTQPTMMMDDLKTLIKTLTNFSLICYTDGIIRLPFWKQQSLKGSIQDLYKTAGDISDPLPPPSMSNFASELLPAVQNILNSTLKGQGPLKAKEILPHATKLWTNLTGSSPALTKQFEGVPDLILKLAKENDKLEEVTGFIKQACDILAIAYNTPYQIPILKLKFQLGVDSLLPKSKMNEAFIIFKTIQEQIRTEPRESLMLKLKSLIELGKIHITRQEYDKSISCFQQVQIFAAQKISTIELDSEPTLLNARMMHGYVHFLQNNFGEGKKILLQVIPLLERYGGPELKQVKSFLLQARFYLACLLRKSGDLVNALMIQTKVLEERERLFGQKHPNTWSSKLEMALLYSSYDNHDKALLLLRELLEIQEEVLGAPSNNQSLATMNAIAEIELKLGNFDDALELYEAIDLIEQEVLQDQDEMRISTQLNQAEVLMSLGQYKEAVDIFDLVHALRSTSEDKSQRNMTLCEDILNKREKAQRSMEVLGNYWLSLTPENVDDPSELAALAKKHEVAMELTENQDNHGALRFLREVLEDSTNLEDTNRFLLNVKADLARVLGLVGKFNESFSVYKEIIPLMDATFGETDELTMLCKDTMGQVFLFSGNQFLKRQMSNLKWFLF